MRAVIQKPLRSMLDALLPSRCVLCDARGFVGFCANCWPLLPWATLSCEVCGVALREVGICGACQAHPPCYDYAVIPFCYRAPISLQIHKFKYSNQLRFAPALAAMLIKRIYQQSQALPEVLIPMPLHRARLRQRGFNQAQEIARTLGEAFSIKLDNRLLQRIKNTVSQTNLRGYAARQQNMQGAFRAGAAYGGGGVGKYQHVALVDDVVTTGSTVNAAAKALKRIGIAKVSVWAVARS